METMTNTYLNGDFSFSEKLCTLKEFVEMGRLSPGQQLLIGMIEIRNGREVHYDAESFWVGDATPYHQPSDNDGGFGWDYDSPVMSKYVLEIHKYEP